MVKISNIDIKNFKFYINESIDISSNNFLIYGENGVGKSSLYLALYHLFYGYFDNSILENISDLKHRNIPTDENIKLTIKLSNNENIEIINSSISSNSTILTQSNIYFLDYIFLGQFIGNKDFFITINNIKNRFSLFTELLNQLEYIEANKEIEDYDILMDKRFELDNQIVEKLDKIKAYTNKIVEELKEDFSVSFIFENSALDREPTEIKFYNPKIFIEINGYRDLKLHFNESKIKILSLALVFAIIKLNQEEFVESNNNDLKLLVLDDFLSSLDMGNRLYIMEYIFNNFEDYQKIILTHNLSFFSIIKRVITYHGEDNTWNKTNLYRSLQKDGFYVPKLINEKKYLEEAKKYFEDDKFEECGNLLRKEIERIIAESNMLFEIGRKENLESAIKNLINEKRYFINPNKILIKVEKEFNGFKDEYISNPDIPDNRKLEILVQTLNNIFKNPRLDSQRLNQILRDIDFYKNTILNKASHYSEEEHYHKEYREAINDVQKLKNIFDEFNILQ